MSHAVVQSTINISNIVHFESRILHPPLAIKTHSITTSSAKNSSSQIQHWFPFNWFAFGEYFAFFKRKMRVTHVFSRNK